MTKTRPTQRRRMASPRRLLVLTLIIALAGAGVWGLWALPANASVRDARPHPIGSPVEATLAAGERVGIWSNSVAADLEVLKCEVTGPQGVEVATRRAPALNWDDTLWWYTSRPGFAQLRAFEAAHDGKYSVQCRDATGWYEGEFLLASDSFGGGSVGLGRFGSNDFATGTILAFCAVVCPLLAGLLAVMAGFSAVSRRLS